MLDVECLLAIYRSSMFPDFQIPSLVTCHPSPRPAGIGLWILRQNSSAVEKPDPVSGDNR